MESGVSPLAVLRLLHSIFAGLILVIGLAICVIMWLADGPDDNTAGYVPMITVVTCAVALTPLFLTYAHKSDR